MILRLKSVFQNFKYPVESNKVNITKILICDKVLYDTKVLNTLLDTKMMKKPNHL